MLTTGLRQPDSPQGRGSGGRSQVPDEAGLVKPERRIRLLPGGHYCAYPAGLGTTRVGNIRWTGLSPRSAHAGEQREAASLLAKDSAIKHARGDFQSDAG